MIVQLEAMEYRGLEAGMSLVVFEEKTASALECGGEVGDEEEAKWGKQTGTRLLYRPAFWIERESTGVCTPSHLLR